MSNTLSESNNAQSVLSDIADSAAEGIQKGKEDAYEAVERTLPVIKQSVRKGTYISCYYLAFGVVYSAKVIEGLLPKDSVILHGLKDGAQAAKEAYEHQHPQTNGISGSGGNNGENTFKTQPPLEKVEKVEVVSEKKETVTQQTVQLHPENK